MERALEKKIQQAPVDQKAKILTQQNLWPELLTAKDILNLPPDPTKWIWDKCLPVGGCSILVAKPKVGKSTLAVCLALAVARGMSFLNRETQQGPVAYLSLDASLPEIGELFLHFGLRETDPVFFHAGAPPHDSVTWIMHRIKQNGVKLVIIDTLQRLFRFKNINDYSEVTNTIEPLLESARQESCHVMLTHHAKKEALDDLDSCIGSTALRGMFYQYLHIKKLGDSDTRIFRTEGRGGKNFLEYAIGFDGSGFLGILGSREDAEADQLMPSILAFVEGEPGCTEKQIMAATDGRWQIKVRAVRMALKNHELERTGTGKRGDAFRYYLPEFLVPKSIENGGNENMYVNLNDNSSKKILVPREKKSDGNENMYINSKKNLNRDNVFTPNLLLQERKGNGNEKLFLVDNPDTAGTYSTSRSPRERAGTRNDKNGNEHLSRPTPLVDKVLSEIEKEKL